MDPVSGNAFKKRSIQHVLRTEKGETVQLPENIVLEGVLAEFRPREIVIEPILYRKIVLGVVVLARSTPFLAEEGSVWNFSAKVSGLRFKTR